MNERDVLAFPNYVLDSRGVFVSGGMSLRDYIAAAALQGLGLGHEYSIRPESDRSIFETHARAAYQYADAMLKERAK